MPLQSTRGASSAKGFGFGAAGAPGIIATGGSITYNGDYAVHTFSASGTFTVSRLGSAGNNLVEYMVIAGGGNGIYSPSSQGGGGAGGYRANNAENFAISVTAYTIAVGTGSATNAASGTPSSFSTISATGGGGSGASGTGSPGGSGGGGGSNGGPGNAGGFTPVEGYPGGNGNSGPYYGRGGGGGSSGAGSSGGGYAAGGGGPGTANDITGTSVSYASGGSGESNSPSWGPIGPSTQTIPGNGSPSSRDGVVTSANGVVVITYNTKTK